MFWPNGAKLPMIRQLAALAGADNARLAIAIALTRRGRFTIFFVREDMQYPPS
jgi:hypothetical protein